MSPFSPRPRQPRSGRLRKRLSSNRRGVSAVEFALVAPVFFLIIFGGIEFYRVSTLRQLAENVSYESARRVIVPGANVTEANQLATNLLNAMNIRGATVVVTPNPILETTGRITVRVTIPASANRWGWSFFSRDVQIISETTLLTEREIGRAHV